MKPIKLIAINFRINIVIEKIIQKALLSKGIGKEYIKAIHRLKLTPFSEVTNAETTVNM